MQIVVQKGLASMELLLQLVEPLMQLQVRLELLLHLLEPLLLEVRLGLLQLLEPPHERMSLLQSTETKRLGRLVQKAQRLLLLLGTATLALEAEGRRGCLATSHCHVQPPSWQWCLGLLEASVVRPAMLRS